MEHKRVEVISEKESLVNLLYSALRDFPDGSVVKNPPAMQETQVQSLNVKDALKEGIATHASILAWRIPWTVEPGRLQSIVTKSWTQVK